MRSLPSALEELIGELGRLPGIGKKTATRLAFHILNTPDNEANELAIAIANLKKRIRFCSICFNLAEEDLCSVCKDTARNRYQICVVEDPSSIVMIDKTNEYNGLFHVLGGVISPLDGISPDDLHIKELLNRLEGAKEIILALNPSTEGEATNIYLARLIKPIGVKITRLASGIPLGSHLEFIDELTLSKALKSRIEL
jgi:recombination protein RecR